MVSIKIGNVELNCALTFATMLWFSIRAGNEYIRNETMKDLAVFGCGNRTVTKSNERMKRE